MTVGTCSSQCAEMIRSAFGGVGGALAVACKDAVSEAASSGVTPSLAKGQGPPPWVTKATGMRWPIPAKQPAVCCLGIAGSLTRGAAPCFKILAYTLLFLSH